MSEFLESQRRNLENLFFQNEDRKLVAKLREMRKMKETKQALAEVSGIHNDAVLEKLVALGVRPETLASLSMLPLIEVAWADGDIDEREKTALLSAAEKNGVARGSVDRALLEEWMARKPAPALLDAWRHYVQGLCEKLSAKEKTDLKTEILGHARVVAGASGGFAGIGTVSKAEKELIKKLEDAFA